MNLFRTITAIMFFVAPRICLSQEIKGTIRDSDSGQPVAGAIVREDSTFIRAVSDVNGQFIINGRQENIAVAVSHISFQTQKIILSAKSENTILLSVKPYLSDEINIYAIRAYSNSAIAYSEINKEEIEKKNLGHDIPFLLSLQTSVVSTSDAGAGVGYTGIRIRGSDASRINVTMNGIPVNDAESQQVYWVDLPDLASSVENMQVQRGLGTSTNGAGAFGGSVNIQTNNVSTVPFGKYSSSAGSFNTNKNTAEFGTGILSDFFSVEGRFSKIISNGYIDRAKSDLISGYISAGYYGKKNSLRAIYLSGKEKTYQAWNGVPEDSLQTNRTYNSAGKYHDDNGSLKYYDNQTDNYRQDYYQLIYSHEVNHNFNLNAALHYTKGKGYYDEYIPYDDPYGNGYLSTYGISDFIIGADTISSTDLVRQRWLDNDFYGFTFSSNYSLSNSKLTLGGAGNRYMGKHFDEIDWMKNNFGVQDHFRYSDDKAHKDDFNAFLKYSINISSRLNLFADLQYRMVSYQYTGFDAALEQAKQKTNLNFFNPKAGASFDIDARQKIYVSAGLGHKEPIREDFIASSPLSRPKPEQMLDFEAGYKYSGPSTLIGINFYSMDYKDQLVLTGKINDVGEYPRQNVGKSFRRGIEAEVTQKLYSNLSFSGNVTLSENKISDYVQYIDSSDDAQNYTQVIVNFKKTNISFSPAVIGSALIEYSPANNFSIAFDTKYVGKQYLDNTSNEERKIKPYLIRNLLLNYNFKTKSFKNIGLKLAVYNLFDQKYESNGYTYPNYWNGVFSNSNNYFPQAGINFLGGIAVSF